MKLRSLAIPPLLALGASAQAAVADYAVRFDATWSAATHPGAFPADAQFSKLVGGTHSAAVSFWQPGELASFGLEVLAEGGVTGFLEAEVQSAILAGTAGQVVLGPTTATPGAVEAHLTATAAHSRVTLAARIAPSPDWFVGARDVELLENGHWVAERTVELFAYDAGTDSGLTFTAPNDDTDPPEPIALMTQGPFFGVTPLGRLTFTRLAAIEPFGCDLNPEGSLVVVDPPYVGETTYFDVHDPIGATLGIPSTPILAASALAYAPAPCGPLVPGLGLASAGASGELLLVAPPLVQVGAPWLGAPVPISLNVPSLATLAGQRFYAQGAMLDPFTGKVGLGRAVLCWIGP